ncbi:hypothetical protein CSW64_17880 [Caulobacter mirabilis]|uniref:DUF6916 domain-containing protein n=2 Tax=Caulobacter mirabilis TaxID=69666 RepID=A0A2D2B1L1_9CAUL|nr:hypothetical protein [Caulobacter mirabilis]ATQ44123.1 hypothetical protein CSW64_17880 [Caulobacter mirabilis]
MQLMSREAFAGRANETFDVSLGESSLPMTLVEVQALTPHAFPGMSRAPFSLVFRSGSPVVLPQKTYRLTNATMGPVDLFLVPVGRDVQGILYQAVFN